MIQGTYSSQGFRVVAGNALELITGTQAASAGYVAENIRATGQVLHGDLARISGDILGSNAALREVNQAGFDAVSSAIQTGNVAAGVLGALNLATQAFGFLKVSSQLSQVNGELAQLREDVGLQAAEMARLQTLANAKLESLVQVAERTLLTQERILEALVQSRAGEAQQLIRQGWENLRHGYREDAASRFERALEYDNTVYISHAMLADICRERKDAAKAEAHYQRAVAFAGDKGPDIKAHAHMQYARFLEEAQRFAEGARQVELALAIQERPAWRFFLAELLVATGNVAAGLATLRQAIDSDASLYLAVLMSPRLSQHEAMAAFLVEVDGAVRGPLLAELARLKTFLRDLAAASARLLALDKSPSLDELRAQELALLQAVATRPFQELKALASSIRQHAQALEAMAERIGDSLQPDVLEVASRLGALLRLVPARQEPEVASKADSIATDFGPAVAVAAYGLAGFAGIGGCASLVNEQAGTGFVLLAVAVVVVLVTTGIRGRQAGRLKMAPKVSRAEASSLLLAWQDFLQKQAQLCRELAEVKASALARLDAAGGASVWPAARPRLEAIATPPDVKPPLWVLEEASRCLGCGALCRIGGGDCVVCGGLGPGPVQG